MTRIIITLTLSLFSMLIFAQSPFDKFKGNENVTSVVVNKKMFELLGKVKMDDTDKKKPTIFKYGQKTGRFKSVRCHGRQSNFRNENSRSQLFKNR